MDSRIKYKYKCLHKFIIFISLLMYNPLGGDFNRVS
jgi:hypothetical protein